VLRCRDFAHIAGLDMGCDATRQFLVEEFASGPPLETDGLVFGDRLELFGVTEQVVSKPPFFFVEGYLFPSARPPLERTTRSAISALGLRDAGFSIEFRGDAVIEVNGRLGEDDGFPDLFRAALCEYPILRWLRGGTAPVCRAPGGHAIAYANSYRAGIVKHVTPAEGATVVAAAGTRLFAPPHPDVAPHLAWALASHPDGARPAYEAARAVVERVGFDIELMD
jgi:hypothetical protein